MSQPAFVQRLSTQSVAAGKRFDFWTSALSNSMFPLIIKSEQPESFNAEVSQVAIGPLTIFDHSNNGVGSQRTFREIAHSEEHSYHLMMSPSIKWRAAHRGRHRFGPGDLILIDSRFEHDIFVTGEHRVLAVKMSPTWLSTWVPDTNILAGRPIAKSSVWGRVLSSVVDELSPQYVFNEPIWQSAMVDHIGSLLALVADGLNDRRAPQRQLAVQIEHIVFDCCTDPNFSAERVSLLLDREPRFVHAAMRSVGKTFLQELNRARIERAVQLLQTPAGRTLTTEEVGTRVGYTQHFTFLQQFELLTGRKPEYVGARIQ